VEEEDFGWMKRQNAKYYLAGLVSIITFIIYLTSLQNDFLLWDDNYYVFENPHIRSLDLAFFKWAFFDFYAANWHPLTWISHAIDYAVWGLNPLGHHLTNNILHSVSTFLVVLLVVRLVETVHSRQPSSSQVVQLSSNDSTTQQLNYSPFIVAGVTGLLFGLHPIHVESVAWVAERKDLLCALFYLLSIRAYVKYATTTAFNQETEFHHRGTETQRESKTQISNSPFSVPLRLCGPFPLYKHYLSALAFFILALLSKPMAVSLPVVLLILDWYPFERIRSLKTFRTVFIEKLPFMALSIASSTLTIMAQKEAIVPMELVPLTSRVLVGVKSLMGYLWKMVLPVNLLPYYPYPKNVSLLSLEYFVAFVLVTGLTVFCLTMAKKQKLWLSAWGYYVITLIPVLGIVQVGAQSMADRYTYLPSLGPFLIIGLVVAWGSSWIDREEKWRPVTRLLSKVIAVAAFVSLIYLTSQQIHVWKNGIELWNCVIENEPMKIPLAYYNRGIAFDRAGQSDKAIEDYDKAIALNPSHFEAYNNRGMVFKKIGQLNKAIEDFGSAIAVNPVYYQAYYNRALVFEQMNQFDRAIENYDRTLALNPSYSEAYNNRGIVFDKMGQYDKAMEDYDKAIALNPSHFEAYYNLGIVYGKAALFDKAVEAFNRAIAININYPYAYGGRGLAYSHLGQYSSALNDFNKALGLDHNYAKAYVYRGKIYLNTGNKEFAIRDFQKACDLGDEEGCEVLKRTH
jgi:tetratricopeptide (TPR) repeat protein